MCVCDNYRASENAFHCCSVLHGKLSLMVIFERKPIPKNVQFMSGVVLQSSKGVDGPAGSLVLAVKDMGQKAMSTIGKKLLLVWDHS